MTNHHVVKGCSSVEILNFDTRVHRGDVTAVDQTNDLALIETQLRPRQAPALRTTNVRIGENVWVYGFPLAGLLANSGNFTGGTISAMTGLDNDTRMFQISAPVQPGNSGGPLLDNYGNVVGVVVGKLNAIAIAERINDLPQNVNFAIKSQTASTFLEVNNARFDAGLRAVAIDSSDIADWARSFTVQIKCEPGSPVSVKASEKLVETGPALPSALNSPKSPKVVELSRTVPSDRKLQLDFLYSLEPDCSSVGFASVRVIEEPQHGKLTSENGTGFSSFPQSNLRYECNKRRTEGVILSYEPSAGYIGRDAVTIEVIYASGNSAKRHYAIEVK